MSIKYNIFKYISILIILMTGIIPVINAKGQGNNTTILGYNNTTTGNITHQNSTGEYETLIKELQANITKLQKELEKKNRLLAEYIKYKKENIKLEETLTKLQNKIKTLEAENELLKEENKEYRNIITELISKTSNITVEEYILAYKKWKRDVSNFTTALIVSIVGCIIIGVVLLKLKKRYDYPL